LLTVAALHVGVSPRTCNLLSRSPRSTSPLRQLTSALHSFLRLTSDLMEWDKRVVRACSGGAKQTWSTTTLAPRFFLQTWTWRKNDRVFTLHDNGTADSTGTPTAADDDAKYRGEFRSGDRSAALRVLSADQDDLHIYSCAVQNRYGSTTMDVALSEGQQHSSLSSAFKVCFDCCAHSQESNLIYSHRSPAGQSTALTSFMRVSYWTDCNAPCNKRSLIRFAGDVHVIRNGCCMKRRFLLTQIQRNRKEPWRWECCLGECWRVWLSWRSWSLLRFTASDRDVVENRPTLTKSWKTSLRKYVLPDELSICQLCGGGCWYIAE